MLSWMSFTHWESYAETLNLALQTVIEGWKWPCQHLRFAGCVQKPAHGTQFKIAVASHVQRQCTQRWDLEPWAAQQCSLARTPPPLGMTRQGIKQPPQGEREVCALEQGSPTSEIWCLMIWGGAVKVKVAQSCPTLRFYGLLPVLLLCPWNSPGKSTRAGCHCLLQGIFPTGGLNPGFPHCRWILYQLSHKWSLM